MIRTPMRRAARLLCTGLAGATLVTTGAWAQWTSPVDPLNTGPRGMTDTTGNAANGLAQSAAQNPYGTSGPVPSTAGSQPTPTTPMSGGDLRLGNAPAAPAVPPRQIDPLQQPTLLGVPPGPLPPNPIGSPVPIVFGSQIFSGRFGAAGFSGFNADYQVTVGDRVSVRMWGAFPYDAVQTVDSQGNIFVPNVGPIRVTGVRNAELNRQVEQAVKRVFRANVGVYARLEAAQPVKLYVTGFVRAPGLYAGLSSDSVLAYLDRAGGIDPDRGSFLDVEVRRGDQTRARLNLYDFLLQGRIPTPQLQDGDTVVVMPRRATAQVSGEVLNPYIFEFNGPRLTAADLMAMARPRPGATHMSIVRKVGPDRRSDYFALSQASEVAIEDGDEVTITSDKYPGTILVRVDGAQLGPRTLVLPYGARLRDAMERVKPAPQANPEAAQLFRKSVAARQKDRLEVSLRSLETYALTSRSATSEEAALRTREAEMILQFVERARAVQPKGQVLLAQRTEAPNMLLEDGDVIQIPERSNLVLVSGEVTFPNALVWERGITPETYVARAGGYTQDADKDRIVVLHQDGSVADGTRSDLLPGDEVLVLPKVQSKNIEVTRGITQILYQIAVAAKVAFGL